MPVSKICTAADGVFCYTFFKGIGEKLRSA